MVDGCTLARPAVADDERVGIRCAGEDCGAVQRCRIHEGAAVIAVAAVTFVVVFQRYSVLVNLSSPVLLLSVLSQLVETAVATDKAAVIA